MPPKKGSNKPDIKAVRQIWWTGSGEMLIIQKPDKKDNVDEAPLQAVILADSYNRRFEVLCSDTPRILLPLCSKSLLDWTLEALSLSKVKQVFVFCGVHADLIRDHVRYVCYLVSVLR